MRISVQSRIGMPEGIRKTLALVIMTCTVSCGLNDSVEELKPGAQYEIIGSVYLMAVYNSLNDRRLSVTSARAYLHSRQLAEKSFVAFQVEVPIGTIMTIMTPAKKVWHIPELVDQYVVRLEPDPSRGLDVVLELDRGIEGDMDGLNPKLFARVEG